MDLLPELHAGSYVFVCVSEPPPGAVPVAFIQEQEGLTLVLPREQADRMGLHYDYVAAWITLRAETTLDQVGVTADFATRLAADGISCNVIAGVHHDHLFVPRDDAARAVALLASSDA